MAQPPHSSAVDPKTGLFIGPEQFTAAGTKIVLNEEEEFVFRSWFIGRPADSSEFPLIARCLGNRLTVEEIRKRYQLILEEEKRDFAQWGWDLEAGTIVDGGTVDNGVTAEEGTSADGGTKAGGDRGKIDENGEGGEEVSGKDAAGDFSCRA